MDMKAIFDLSLLHLSLKIAYLCIYFLLQDIIIGTQDGKILLLEHRRDSSVIQYVLKSSVTGLSDGAFGLSFTPIMLDLDDDGDLVS
jgi:hypothetical protein